MNYQKILDDLIFKRKISDPLVKTKDNKGTIECHHIIMRSMGGSNDPSNLVNLTLKEHYFVHELMVKIYKDTEFEVTVIRAWNGMSRKMGSKTKTSRLYQILREKYNLRAGDSVRGKICINDGKNNKYIFPNEQIPEGFQIGMCPSEKRTKHIQELNRANIGKIRINNGKIEILAYPNEIPPGFRKGCLREGGNKGKIIVNNGQQQLFADVNDIPDGFVAGPIPLSGEKLRQKSEKSKKQWKSFSRSKRKSICNKISAALKGKSSWSKGKTFSEAHKRKISEANTGKKLSVKQKKIISKRQLGKIKVNNGKITIYADPNNIPSGFVKGQIWKNPDKKRTSTNGQKKMTNPKTHHTLYVKSEFIQQYRDNGYVFPSEL